MDMPIHVMENVAEYLDSFDRAKLVQTSRSLRIFVEDQKLFHHTLKLDVSMRRATISFNESVNIKYIKEYAACRKIFKNREEIFRGVAYWKQAIRDFKKILNNSKLHLNTLAIKLPAAIELSFNKRNVFNNLEDAFKFTHHLNVKNLILNEYSSSLLTRILPTLKPGYLTSIDIDSHNPNEYSLENVLEMEQWKQAKYFRMDGFHFIWPLRHLYHLKEFAIILERLSVEHILQLKEILFNSPYFGKCLITVDDGIDTNAIKKEFECDPNFEREKDKKYYDLSDMPIDVMEKIVGDLDIFDRISLAKTSRSFQTFVKDQKLFHHTLGLEVHRSVAEISFADWVNINYTRNQNGCVKTFKKREKLVEGVAFWEEALRDYKSILNNPKLHLDTLEIEFYVRDSCLEPLESLENAINVLEDTFKFNHYLNVKMLVLRKYSPEQIFKILPTLKPGYLETINIFSANPNLDSLNTVFETEQWKQAKWFGMDGACFIWPLHHLYHFERFTVILKKMSVEEVREMKEVLFASPNFEECYVLVVNNSGANAIKEEFVILKNDPIALRQCIRYDSLRRKPIQKYYSFNRSVIGNEVIDYNNFNLSFHEFSKQKSNNKEGEKPIAGILRNDKYALRVCILYESLKYLSNLNGPIFDIFVNLCKAIGDEDVLKFQEFEVWFYRFLNGAYDLNYERDEEKKIYELSDMPIDVMKNIAEYLDILDRANLGRTSRSLQTFVEDQKLFHHTLNLTVFNLVANVSFSRWVSIEYTRSRSGCVKNFNGREKSVAGPFWEQALMDLKSILKNPKLYLNTLKITLHSKDEPEVSLNDLEAALKFNHYSNVKNLKIVAESSDALIKILPSLKPGYLTTIDIFFTNPNGNSMKILFELVQWKRAKCFFMDGNRFIWPLRHLYHFVDFEVHLMELSVKDVHEMKEVLFKSPNFETCLIRVLNDTGANAIEEVMTDFFKSNPIALRHCLLYEYLRKNPVEQSFIALRKTFGPDIIKKKMFNCWFYRFKQGVVFDKSEDKKSIADMKEVLRSDKHALRACVLYESLKYKLADRESSINSLPPYIKLTVNEIKSNPSFAMYKMFCEVVGEAVMEYQEFDFWF
ncbi:unnamed protein product, partial [Caenorhabditis brenneri]